jgi:hypothetical protein
VIKRPGYQNLITLINHHIGPLQRSPAGKIINGVRLHARFKAGLAWSPWGQHGRQRTIDRGSSRHSAAYIIIGAVVDLDHINLHV